ncbi:uncharacterized protein LOC116289241 [Actinia tenebrosa]|uniref:Uncharacterized protein LOC116289241 n=1 Tax=Actinia tenebrosa TaxID=6105 RepID=A0A6P8H8Z2_ACTTE|nr:uncharacterized protein LOC116289241 [Actinia tenebrosa]
MSNLKLVSKSSYFMIENILRSTHNPQDGTLTYECPSTPNENQQISSNATSCASEFKVPSKAKATRAYPSAPQKKLLLEAFSIEPYPSKEQMTQIAGYLGFNFEKVRRWFENRRKTEKRRQSIKLRKLDDLASNLSSPRQHVSQAQPVRSCSYYGNQVCTPVPYPSATTCRNYGLVQRSYIRPMPLYRRAVQTCRVEPASKHMAPAYELTHASQHLPLTQRNALPSSSLRPVLYSYKTPVVYRFQV